MLIMWLEMGDNWTPAFICFADKDDVKDVVTAYDVSKPNCKNWDKAADDQPSQWWDDQISF